MKMWYGMLLWDIKMYKLEMNSDAKKINRYELNFNTKKDYIKIISLNLYLYNTKI